MDQLQAFGFTLACETVVMLLHHSHVVTVCGDSYRLNAKHKSGLV